MFQPQPEQPRVCASKRVGVQLLHLQPRATGTASGTFVYHWNLCYMQWDLNRWPLKPLSNWLHTNDVPQIMLAWSWNEKLQLLKFLSSSSFQQFKEKISIWNWNWIFDLIRWFGDADFAGDFEMDECESVCAVRVVCELGVCGEYESACVSWVCVCGWVVNFKVHVWVVCVCGELESVCEHVVCLRNESACVSCGVWVLCVLCLSKCASGVFEEWKCLRERISNLKSCVVYVDLNVEHFCSWRDTWVSD